MAENTTHAASRIRAASRALAPAVALAVFAIALLVLRHELRHYGYHQILAAAHTIAPAQIATALLLTIISFGVLVSYDWLALRYAGPNLRPGRIAFASFTGYALSQSLGFPLLTGGSVRARLYSAWGVSTPQIAAALAFNSITFLLGLFFVTGVAFVIEPVRLPGLMHMRLPTQPLGVLCLLACGGYVLFCARVRREVRLIRWRFTPPAPPLAAAQLTIGTIDWLVAGAVLYSLLPAAHGLSYPAFMSVFLLSQGAGLLSHLPGGVGVFDTIALIYLEQVIHPVRITAALLVYRVTYYILPLLIATTLLVARELRQQRVFIAQAGQVAVRSVSIILPHALAALTMFGGVVLLFSGATPAVPHRLRMIGALLPLGILEASHFLASIVGTALVILSWAVARRLDAAYHAALALLAGGIALSLLKGLDYEEALALSVVLIALIFSRREFDRRASLLAEAMSLEWSIAVAGVLLATTWLGLFAYKHVPYSGELWWQFALHGNAPRFLRATAGAVGLTFVFGMLRLLRPASPSLSVADTAHSALLHTLVASAPDTYANLALLGDKAVIFNETRRAFIMYGVAGKSWIAMGDPVGPQADAAEVAWSFLELADKYAAHAVFYEASDRFLPLYIELGLSLWKIGEEGRVLTRTFTLQGRARSSLRRAVRTLADNGAQFEIVQGPTLLALLPELKVVSDDWLQSKHTREKGFSLGTFDEGYIRQFPVAVVRLQGSIVAFANLWLGAQKHEVAPDLMRHTRAAPRGIMDFLFTNLILWSREQGYEWFNLGMTPLTGLDARPLAPRWNRLGTWVYRHGEHFYNFQGLREYKEKFDPVWEPRYLASRGVITLPRVLSNLTVLIAGGVKGLVAR